MQNNDARRRPGALLRDPWVLATLAAGAALLILLGPAGYRLQWTPSIPRGIYREQPVTHVAASALVGNYVSVCLDSATTRWALERTELPGRGCPLRTGRLAKQVIAGPGDVVAVGEHRLEVNGHVVTARLLPAAHRAAPGAGPGVYRLGAGEIWIFAPNPHSLDSRLIGPVPASQVRGRIRRVWAP